ncbi:hypothetical protein EE612_043458, partial [Oryza sativa]
ISGNAHLFLEARSAAGVVASPKLPVFPDVPGRDTGWCCSF